MAKRGTSTASAQDTRAKDRELSQTDYSKYDFSYSTKNYEVRFEKGLSEGVVRKISAIKKEPAWMLDLPRREAKLPRLRKSLAARSKVATARHGVPPPGKHRAGDGR